MVWYGYSVSRPPAQDNVVGLDGVVVVTGLGIANWQLQLGQNREQAR